MYVEKKRRPKIEMSPAPQLGNDVGGRPMTTIRVKVSNEDPKQWYGRLPALRCFGRITIYEYNSMNKSFRWFDETYARWAALAQPMPLYGYSEVDHPANSFPLSQTIYDTNRYDPIDQEPEQKKDIYPGFSADLDLACRFIDENTCVIWTNQWYQPPFLPIGPPHIIILNPGIYLLRIKISSSSANDFRSTFWLFNQTGRFWLDGPITTPDRVMQMEVENEQKKERLLHAFQQKDTSELSRLLEDKTYRTINLGSSWTPLMVLSFRGDWQLVNLLINYNEDVNAREDAGYTPLFFAVAGGHIAVANLLVNRGANVNARNRQGITPLGLARQKHDSGMIHFLLQKGATM